MVDQHIQMRHTVSLSKRSLNMDHKIPYVDVISEAILASPHQRLTAKEIFEQVSSKYGPMKKAETLKNTIRHTLSRYKVFRKLQRGRQKKPNWWTVDEEILNSVNQTNDGQQVEWRPEPAIPLGHASQQPQQQQQQNVALCGVQPYMPSSRPFMFIGGVNLGQTAEHKQPSAFQEPPRIGPVCNNYFNQPDVTPARIAGLTTIGPSFQQPVAETCIRDCRYVISVEGFPTTALSASTSGMFPIQSVQPPLAFN